MKSEKEKIILTFIVCMFILVYLSIALHIGLRKDRVDAMRDCMSHWRSDIDNCIKIVNGL